MGILPSTHHAPLIALDTSVFSKSVKFRPKAGQVEHKLGLGADDSVLITFSACDAIRHAANTTNHEPAINLHKRSIDDLHTSWELQENVELRGAGMRHVHGFWDYDFASPEIPAESSLGYS